MNKRNKSKKRTFKKMRFLAYILKNKLFPLKVTTFVEISIENVYSSKYTTF